MMGNSGLRHKARWSLGRRLGVAGLAVVMSTGAVAHVAHAAPLTVVTGNVAATPSRARLVPPGTGSAQVERMRQAVDGPRLAAADDLPSPCWTNVQITSEAANHAVFAEYGNPLDPGVLRAGTRYSGGSWGFTVCRNPDNWDTVIQAEGPQTLMVAAEVAYPGTDRGLLRARTPYSAIGPWEHFTTINPPWSNKDTWIFSPSAGKYVSVQLDYGSDPRHANTLRARLGSVGPWETFSW